MFGVFLKLIDDSRCINKALVLPGASFFIYATIGAWQ